MTRIPFTLEDIIKLIKLYKQEKSLWCQDLKDYRDNKSRQSALQRISENWDNSLNKSTITHVKNKIKTIRYTYNKELKRIRENYLAGVKYTPKLRWYDEMYFLPDYIKIKDLTNRNLEQLEIQPLPGSEFIDDSKSDLAEDKTDSITINDENSQSGEDFLSDHVDDEDLEFLDEEIQTILIKGILKTEAKQKEHVQTELKEEAPENSNSIYKNLKRKRTYDEYIKHLNTELHYELVEAGRRNSKEKRNKNDLMKEFPENSYFNHGDISGERVFDDDNGFEGLNEELQTLLMKTRMRQMNGVRKTK